MKEKLKSEYLNFLSKFMPENVRQLIFFFCSLDKLAALSVEIEIWIRDSLNDKPNSQYLLFLLGLSCEFQGKLDEAIVCYLRAINLGGGGQWQSAFRLFQINLKLGRTDAAKKMSKICASYSNELRAIVNQQLSYYELLKSNVSKRVMLVAPNYWPSVGGVETIVEHLAISLVDRGYDVHVATSFNDNRDIDRHKGIRIHSFPFLFDMIPDIPGGVHDLDLLVKNGGFKVLIMVSHPGDLARYLCT